MEELKEVLDLKYKNSCEHSNSKMKLLFKILNRFGESVPSILILYMQFVVLWYLNYCILSTIW